MNSSANFLHIKGFAFVSEHRSYPPSLTTRWYSLCRSTCRIPILGSFSRRVLCSLCQHHASLFNRSAFCDTPALFVVLGQIFHEFLIFARPFDGKPAFGSHGGLPARAGNCSFVWYTEARRTSVDNKQVNWHLHHVREFRLSKAYKADNATRGK